MPFNISIPVLVLIFAANLFAAFTIIISFKPALNSIKLKLIFAALFLLVFMTLKGIIHAEAVKLNLSYGWNFGLLVLAVFLMIISPLILPLGRAAAALRLKRISVINGKSTPLKKLQPETKPAAVTEGDITVFEPDKLVFGIVTDSDTVKKEPATLIEEESTNIPAETIDVVTKESEPVTVPEKITEDIKAEETGTIEIPEEKPGKIEPAKKPAAKRKRRQTGGVKKSAAKPRQGKPPGKKK